MLDYEQETWTEKPGETKGGSAAGQETWTEKPGETKGGSAAGQETWTEKPGGEGGGAITEAAAAVKEDMRGETEESKGMREKFGFFGPATLLYAVFYAFCMYRNGSGVTFPFFAAGSLLYLYFSFTKLKLTLKRGSIFYMAAVMLLGISTFCTDDTRIIFFNKLGIFLLMMSLLLKQFFDTTKWGLGKYLGSICQAIFACLGELGKPFRDAGEFRKKRTGKDDRRIWAVGIGLLTGVPLMLVVLMLLSSADALFRQMTRQFLENISIGGILNVLFRISFLFLISYSLICYLCKRRIREEAGHRRDGEPATAITIAGMLTVLYLVFSVIQIAGLFLGKLQLPEGYTYAAYAREGFFQLLTVSFLNLVIVLTFISFFRESKILKVILTVMSLCTFVMIASSAMRMIIYITYYYLTFLRLLVLWSLGLLTLLFLGVAVSVYRKSFPMFRYSVAVVTVFYLGLSFAHPDYIIARVNVAYTAQDAADYAHYKDYGYLSGLCADAAPVLVPFLEQHGYDLIAFEAENAMVYGSENPGMEEGYRSESSFGYLWMRRMQKRTKDFGIRTFNVSRYRMLKLFRNAAALAGAGAP